jgi:hypothetical protein
MLHIFIKVCWETLNLVKIRRKKKDLPIYMKTKDGFIIAGNKESP